MVKICFSQDTDGERDPLTEIVFVPNEHVFGPFKPLTVSDSPTTCLATNIINGKLLFKAFDANEPHPGDLFIVYKA